MPYSGVEIVTGLQDEQGNDSVYFSGDASGRVLTINNPWGTQAQADDIIAKIRGFTYQPYEATGALLDPTAELGDGISVNDVYSGIYKLSRTFSSLMSANASAPQSEDLDHEYPYESKADRVITRKFSSMESELSINSQKISAKVSQDGGAQNSVSWSLKSSAWSVYANGNLVFRVNSSGAQVVGKITATSGKIGGFDINLNGSNAIQYNGLTWNGNKTGIYLGPSGLQIGSKSGSFFQASSSGDIRAHNLYLTGSLNMGGVHITPQALANGAKSGGAYGVATSSPSPSSFPDYFTTKYLYTKYGITAEGTTTIKGDLYVTGGGVGQRLCKWKTIIVNGVSYVALCQAP